MGKIFKMLMAFFIVAATVLAILTYQKLILDFEEPYTLNAPVTVLIPKGVSAKSIDALLKSKGILPQKSFFYWGLRFRGWGRELQSGEYEFQGTVSPLSIAQKMMSGDVVQHKITIPEGLSSREILALLEQNKILSGKLSQSIPEGSVLAETYALTRGDSKEEFIKRAQRDLDNVLDTLWRDRPDNFPLKTKKDALILASIVEKETAIAAERPRIAGVFFNRLRLGMPLQTDPTIIYAVELKEGKPFEGPLYKKYLSIESPYNTYLHKGLPPGPICHVGIDALRAVMKPLKTDELYFVADGTGGHVFSRTYKEHQKNHQKWRKIRSKR